MVTTKSQQSINKTDIVFPQMLPAEEVMQIRPDKPAALAKKKQLPKKVSTSKHKLAKPTDKSR